ncbi:hypothetical protein B0H15DRAFT_906772 [Mycena belliarum]|uniref:DUF6697 domain-containing protein n=1 Tax=Mycena belliarum TaxID=1033014 RepID=A0AAD6XNA5_9AGAR|nr:hypothetical protein B0H15DRAFT_906772 [Mycena belliae]
MSVESVVYRLNAIGLDPFPITLPDAIRRTTVTRDWISKQYGGPAQGSSPPIDRKRFKHTMDFRFFKLDFNSHLPKNPGDPGLVFYGLGQAEPWKKGPEEVFVRLSQNNWLYVGRYRIYVAESLTADEWKQQSLAVRQPTIFWCRHIKKGGGGRNSRPLRINVDLHRRLGRPPTAAETKEAMDSQREFHLTEPQIDWGFENGHAKLAVWTMKCVGYRADFQRNIAGRIPTGWAKVV